MIEKLKDSCGPAFGFKVNGQLTAEEMHAVSRQIHEAINEHRKPIGILADLSAMQGATWGARWAEMRFLQTHTDHIARLAVVSNDKWEDIAEMTVVATAVMQAQTLYFQVSEIHHAWHWVKMANHDEGMPIRIIHPGKGLFQNYTPEFTGL